jgi:hypothetical protein
MVIQNKSPLFPDIGNNRCVETLIQRVRKHLEIAKSYTAFDLELEPILPNEKMHHEERAKSIQAFAEKNGWLATILDPGIRVIFRKPAA